MIRAHATRAILASRFAQETGAMIAGVAGCIVFAVLRSRGNDSSQTTDALVVAGLIGIVFAVVQRGAGRLRELELCEQSAPLYGRELARATALVPCIMVTIALSAYWAVDAFFEPVSFVAVLVSITGVNAATLAALSATVRRKQQRALYILVGCAIIAAVAFIDVNSPWGAASVALVAGFLALRQYGEALARYDPIG